MAIAVLAPQAPEPAEVVGFLTMIERAARDASIDIDKLDRLLVMRERENARLAERQFHEALALAQAEMEPITTDAKNEQTRSKYASYAALDRAVRPIYTKHGFGLTFNTEDAPGELQARIVCDVCHADGHTRRYRIDMPVDGKGAKGGDVMTKTHAMGSGVSYGMRYLLRMIFNLATDQEDDGNAAGGRGKATLPKKDSREVYTKLQTDIRNADDLGELRAWGEANAERIALLPIDWQDILRMLYAEKLVELRQFTPKRQAVVWEEDCERPETPDPFEIPPALNRRRGR